MINLSFFREAVRSFRSTGAIAPASPQLIKKLVAPLPADRPVTVVELGPGEGCVTRAILRAVHPASTVTAFEINPAFVRRLATLDDPRLRVLATGAERLTEHLAPGSADFVISSLPLSMIPREVKETIITRALLVLRPGGQFLQYQYALQDYALLRGRFGEVSVRLALANLPPAFVYRCSPGSVAAGSAVTQPDQYRPEHEQPVNHHGVPVLRTVRGGQRSDRQSD